MPPTPDSAGRSDVAGAQTPAGRLLRLGRRGSTALPAVLVSLLPKCPACFSVYAGVSSALGVGLTVDERYLLPLTSVLLVVALAALARRTLRRGRPAVLLVGLLSGAGIVIGKFLLASDWLTHVSVVVLLVASLWRSRAVAHGPPLKAVR